MLRRILFILAAAPIAIGLMLFLALVLHWPMIIVYMLGTLPLFIAVQMGAAKSDQTGGEG